MKSVTRNIVGPNSKVYEASFSQAENLGEVTEVATSMGLTIEQVNDALRRAKKEMYLAALDSTVDSKIESAMQALITAGFNPDEAKAVAESKRSSLDSGLPTGLKDLNRLSKRGRPAAEKKDEAK